MSHGLHLKIHIPSKNLFQFFFTIEQMKQSQLPFDGFYMATKNANRSICGDQNT